MSLLSCSTDPNFPMQLQCKNLITITVIVLGMVSSPVKAQVKADDNRSDENPATVLTVTSGKPQISRLSQVISARGDVAAWQEAIIGNENDGLRLTEVKVNVGDEVKKGELLAIFNAETVAADLAHIQANFSEAKANVEEAEKNAQRARKAKDRGAMSGQEIDRYLIMEKATKANLEAQQAAVKTQQLRLKHTRVLAPDSGVISARSATVGAVVKAGQELFRLILHNRLEWRAEVPSAELALLKPGDPASIITPSGSFVEGKVRMIAPSVDPKTRLGLVYVDIPSHPELKAGMFVEGKFEFGGGADALTIEQKAVIMRDGFSYVFVLGANNRVSQVKVQLGRRSGDRIEVKDGLQADAVLVTSGVGFLNDGDIVKVVSPSKTEQKAQKF